MAYKLLDSNNNELKVNGKNLYGLDLNNVVKNVDNKKRSISIIGTDESVDRYGDIVLVKGWQFDNYVNNPVFLWAHNSAHSFHGIPIGRTTKLTILRKPRKLVEFDIQFPKEGMFPFADLIYYLFSEKFINASSVGFIPIEAEPREIDEEEKKRFYYPMLYKKQELLELSGCAIPANPNALQNIYNAVSGKSFGNILGKDMYNMFVKNEIPLEGHKEAIDSLEIKSIEVTYNDGTKRNFPVLANFEEKRINMSKLCELIDEDGVLEKELNEKVEDETKEIIDETEKQKELDEKVEDETKEILEEDTVDKPYENEHACRVNDPDKYDSFARKNNKFGDGIHVIFGIKDNKSEVQALRFSKDKFSVKEAKAWCKDHDYSCNPFEAAKEIDDQKSIEEKLIENIAEAKKLDNGIMEESKEKFDFESQFKILNDKIDVLSDKIEKLQYKEFIVQDKSEDTDDMEEEDESSDQDEESNESIEDNPYSKILDGIKDDIEKDDTGEINASINKINEMLKTVLRKGE